MADAPFLIRPPTSHHHSLTAKPNARDGSATTRRHGRESGRGLSLGTVHGDSNIEGTLYWNQDVVSSGLVCGTSSKQVLRTVMQMVRLHLNEGRDSSALIFHASTCDHLLPSSRVNTVQLAKRLSSPSVFLSPRARPAVKARYIQTPLPEHDVLPLRIAEKDVTLAHVLSLCTPPSDYPSRERILTSVQYIVSRMAEPFSILEFNQLVDNEQWDEHGSSFMAIRQTLLTTFIIPSSSTSTEPRSFPQTELADSDDIVSRIIKGGPIIVDLSDPILRSTGLDTTLFDMILCLYCVVNPDSRKLLVLDAHEYLANPINTISGSDLSNTLTTLLSLHGDSPIKTLLSCSTDMAHVPQQLLSHLDYLICHEFRSPAWVEYIQKYFFASPSLSTYSPHANSTFSNGEGRRNPSSLYTLEDRHAIVISPRSLLSETQMHSLSPIEEDSTPTNTGASTRNGTKWGARSFRVEIGWEWPLTVEQQKIEQLQALVAQLSQISQNRDHHRESLPGSSVHTEAVKTTGTSDGTLAVGNTNADGVVAGSAIASTHNRRSRKESSTYMETTMTALKSALGYLAARRAVDLSSPPSSPKQSGAGNGLLPLVLPSSRTPPPLDTKVDKSGNQSGDMTDPSSDPDGAKWLKKRGLDAKFTMPSRVRSLQDLGPFPAEPTEALEIDKDKLAEALLEAIIRAGGERGMPISSQKVAEQYTRLTTEASTDFNQGTENRLSMWNGVPALTGFTTWVETINYAQKQGILQLVSNGKEDWVVMPKDSVQSRPMSVIQSPDGWYEIRKDVEQPPPVPPAEPSIAPKEAPKEPPNLAIFDPLVHSITTLRQLQATSSPILLHNVSYELKRRFPTALKDAGYKTILEYLHGAQEHGLLEITDDDSGSIYVQLTVPAVLEQQRKGHLNHNKPPVSVFSASTEKSQPESSAMPSSAAHVPYPRDRFEPITVVLRSLRKHSLYKVTLAPLSLAIEKMFPNALARFGFINIEAYVTQARNAGLVITSIDSNGRTWVSLTETVDTPGSITPTQEQQLPDKRTSEDSSIVSASEFPLPPNSRVSDFSRLLRAVRALTSPGHERVLCSRVCMMLNKEDYRAMNVETFSQCLVAAAKANLIVHGGVGGTAWVALKAPQVAGVSNVKMEEPRARLIKSSPPEYATNPVVPSGSAYKLPLSEQDVEPFKPLLAILRTFIHGKHIAEPFRTVVEKNLIKAKPDVLSTSRCHTMDDYILRAQSYGLIAQVGNGKAARLRLLENSGLSIV